MYSELRVYIPEREPDMVLLLARGISSLRRLDMAFRRYKAPVKHE